MTAPDASDAPARPPFLHPNTAVAAAVIGLNLLLLSAVRILFLVKYHSLLTGLGAGRVALALVHGLRFDLAVTGLLLLLPGLALILPGRWTVRPVTLRVVRAVLCVIFTFELAICTVDLVYFGYVNKHLGAEIVNIRHDLGTMVITAATAYWWAVLLFAATVTGLWFGLRRLFARPAAAPGAAMPRHAVRRPLVQVVVFLLAGVLAVRGGLQSKPLRVAHAFTGDNVMAGHLALNGVFTVLQAVGKAGVRFEVPGRYETAVDTVREVLADAKTEFTDRKFPLLRRHVPAAASAGRPNVVILLMESWSADAVGALGGTAGVTPNFDRLAGEGLLCTDFYSVGQRSIDAVVSMFYAFPSFSGFRVVGKEYEQNQFIGIGSIFKDRGYTTIFLNGARRGSMGFDVFAAKAGFDTYIAKDNFDLPSAYFDGQWGVFDEHLFARADAEFRRCQVPFLGVVYTLNPHAPYAVPSDEFRKIGPDTESAPYLNALGYSDWTLCRFFELARQSPYYANTLFVIVADHPEGHHEKNIRDRFRIPCLFLWPGHLPPGREGQPGSQVDILPSILDLLDINARHASFGSSLFGTGRRAAFISYGNVFGLIRDGYMLLHAIEKPIGLYDYIRDPSFTVDVSAAHPAVVPTMEKELLGLLKVATVTLETNTVAPLRIVGDKGSL
ncbi:MAG: LTA synthase family protein [Planctomycetota bacterium]